MTNIDWRDAIDEFTAHLTAVRAPRTAEFYVERLSLLRRWAEETGKVTLTDFRARHLRQYLTYRATQKVARTDRLITNATRRHDAIAARAFLKFCDQERYIDGNPTAEFLMPRGDRAHVPTPTEDEMRRLLVACQNRWLTAHNPACRYFAPPQRTFFSRRNYAIIAGLVETGGRVNEVLLLKLADYQPDQRRVIFRETKGKKDRVVPISENWVLAVDSYLRIRPKEAKSETLFITEYGNALDLTHYRIQFYRDVAFAGLPRYTLRSIRHFTLHAIATQSLLAAQRIAGHVSSQTTQIYLRADEEHSAEAHAAAAPLGRLLVEKSERQKRQKLL